MTLEGIAEARTLSGNTYISFFTFSEHEHLFIGFHLVRERNVDTENR